MLVQETAGSIRAFLFAARRVSRRDVPGANIGFVKRVLSTALVTLGAVVALYGADYLQLRYRIARNRNAYGTVTVERFEAIKEKNNRTEFVFEEPQTQTCTHSLFPHGGYAPCWYASRHTEKRTDI
ncbi:MAG TPA: hypothetical protein VK473_02515 [Terriglobales bacterium]|nr:hypothetical protein [Terriglobales bacterium]